MFYPKWALKSVVGIFDIIDLFGLVFCGYLWMLDGYQRVAIAGAVCITALALFVRIAIATRD